MTTLSTLLRAAACAAVALASAGCWDAPPVETRQVGFRGVGMEQTVNPRLAAALLARNQAPEVDPPADRTGPRVRELREQYRNVEVLGDLSEGEFLRVMTHMTASIAPADQGCAYCHNLDNMADGGKYQYQVSRRMLQMTRAINTSWTSHVGTTGVTCYTCHRGQPIPEDRWYTHQATDMAAMGGFIGSRNAQNAFSPAVGRTSLPVDAFTPLLVEDGQVRVTGPQALPNAHRVTIEATERNNALMLHMSSALGVNCTYCHNSRNFADWEQAPPWRTTAFHGIRMVREVNRTFLVPLATVLPRERLSPAGESARVFCTSCHHGLLRPLNGAPMLQNYPELGPPRPAPQADVVPPRG